MKTKEFKPRLQANNLDLNEILSDILNLPPAGTEDIQAELEAQTTAVNSLLSMVNRKIAENNGAGKWVWKKAWKYNVNLTQTTTGANPTKFKVTGSGNNTDFTDVGFIVGLKFVSDLGHTLDFIDETSMRHIAPNGTVSDYTYTWDAANATVQMPAQWGSTHVFTEQEALRTKEFIVSAGEFDYPDRTYGDDGYYYAQYYEFYDKPENIRQYIDIFGAIGSMSEGADLLGASFYSNIAVDKFTFASRTASTTKLAHSLGVEPHFALLISNKKITTANNIQMVAWTHHYAQYNTGTPHYWYWQTSSTNLYSGGGSITMDGTTGITLNCGSGKYFEAGVEYTLITMA